MKNLFVGLKQGMAPRARIPLWQMVDADFMAGKASPASSTGGTSTAITPKKPKKNGGVWRHSCGNAGHYLSR
jgi:hypothetical protein